ncbi:MAG TPA: EAL domain-containing protein [Nostocaceae cyanobacterium]|nr:EAL domain-containing protein [Nostocaceae cyanobacterium]
MESYSELNLSQVDILIVDDVLENVRLLSNLLADHGYSSRKATNGTMALTAVAGSLPTLILLDVRMPGMTGYEVCQQLKTNPKTAHIPVIFLSAAEDIANKVQAFQVGGADYITKPFHTEEVLARVKHQLAILAAQQTIYQLNAELEQRVQERTQQLEIANMKLLKMAFSDPLTKLPNRDLLIQKLQTALEQKPANSQFALFYLDCDRFKIVNDFFGHQAGDEVLIAIAHRLQSILDQDTFLARLGGDEFVILLDHLSQTAAITQVADHILQNFSKPFSLRERDFFISFSIGIVSNFSLYTEPEEILRDADLAMYKAKSLGKNQYQIFLPEMYQATRQVLQIETDLRQAIQQQELILYYQPIIQVATGTAVGVEALIRWYHPVQGWISPAQFIPLAEETGLILKLGNWVLQEACHQLRTWQKEQIVDSSFYVSVNVSAYQFAQTNISQQITEILAITQLSPQNLKLEITETTIMHNTTSATNIIRSLQKLGIQFSIDDFGTGYSSLSYLHLFPVDYLKIDRSFTQHLHSHSDSLVLVTAIAQIAKTMGLKLVAEGVETKEQLAQLQLLDVEFVQGYLFSQPLPPTSIIKFINSSLY